MGTRLSPEEWRAVYIDPDIYWAFTRQERWQKCPSESLSVFSQHIDPPHGVARDEIVVFDDIETRFTKFGFDLIPADQETVAPHLPRCCQTPTLFQAFAAPGLEVAIDPQGNDHRVAADPMEFAQDFQASRAVRDVVKQAHAENTVHRVAVQADGGHRSRSEEHTSELQSRFDLVCRLLLEKKK